MSSPNLRVASHESDESPLPRPRSEVFSANEKVDSRSFFAGLEAFVDQLRSKAEGGLPINQFGYAGFLRGQRRNYQEHFDVLVTSLAGLITACKGDANFGMMLRSTVFNPQMVHITIAQELMERAQQRAGVAMKIANTAESSKSAAMDSVASA